MRDLLNCWVTTSVRVLRTSGLWEVAATIALSADAGAGTISNIFWSSSREDVSVNDFCIVEGASVLFACHTMFILANLPMLVSVGLHRQSFHFADGSLDAAE